MRSENAKKNNAWIWTFCLISASLLQKQCAPVLDEKDKHFHEKSEMLSWRNEKPSYIRYWGGLDISVLQRAKIKRTSDIKIRMHHFEIIIKHLHNKVGADQSATTLYYCISSTWILRLDHVHCSYDDLMNNGTRALGDHFGNAQKKMLFFWGCVP